MDFHDSPDEAAFRARIRAWLDAEGDSLRRSHSDDSYWTSLGEWHQRLYDAGFFALAWPKQYGGHELPPVYEVIVDEELARAGAPPKPSLGYLIQGISRHGSDVDQGSIPAGTHQRARPVVPGLQRARRRVRPGVAANHRGPRRRRVRHQRAQGLDELLRRRRMVHRARPHRRRRAQAQGAVGVRRADASAGDRTAPAEDDQRHHDRVRPGDLRRGPCPGANMIGEPGEGWAAGDDDRQSRT